MTDFTPRLSLPFLHAAQAQKEVTHNEALQRLDLWVHAVVEDSLSLPPADPRFGACWIVLPGAGGSWAAQDGRIAQWTEGGWRFATPFEGLQIWHAGQAVALRHIGGEWSGDIAATAVRIGGERVLGPRQGTISLPAGGITVDVECRASVAAIIAALQAHGLIAD